MESSTSIMQIGTFAHEYSHVLGLPDLYSHNVSYHGIGDWGLMATGSHNKKNISGDLPAHMSAWSKIELGWIEPIQVTDYIPSAKIYASSTDKANVYKFGTGNEYFLIENRQQIGFDAGLPASGLAIWHIETSIGTNDRTCHPFPLRPDPDKPDEPTKIKNCDENLHYTVALEQSDGLWELERNKYTWYISYEDAGDLYTNSKNGFTYFTIPNSRFYNRHLS